MVIGAGPFPLPPTELLQRAAVLLRGAPRRRFHRGRGLGQLPMQLFARFARGGGFLVQPLRLGGGTTLLPRSEYPQDIFIGTAPETNFIAGANELGRLRSLAVDLHLATIHGVRRQRARLEVARRPQPFVHPNRIGPERSVIVRGHGIKLTAILALATLTACGGAETAAEQQAAERSAIAAGQATAAGAAALPMTGLWSEAHLMDRLSRAGVLPRAREGTSPAAPWMNKAPIALTAGGGEVYVWIYADSVARRAATDPLDPETGAPRGTTSPFAPPMVFVTNNNLAAVITGGTEQNIERIMLALQAGLPVEP